MEEIMNQSMKEKIESEGPVRGGEDQERTREARRFGS